MNKDYTAVISVIGEDKAALLAMEVGCNYFRIPSQPTQVLIDCIGQDDATNLCNYLSDRVMFLPSRQALDRYSRQNLVSQLINTSRSSREIADMTGLSTNWINKLRKQDGKRV